MPLTDRATRPERLITALPGLAALAYAFTLPDPWLRLLFAAVLAVLCVSALALVLQSRDRIQRWSGGVAVRATALMAAGAIVSLFLFFVARATLYAQYRFPADSDSPATVVLLPTRLRLIPPGVTFPFGDCSDALDERCASPAPSQVASADELAELLSQKGPFEIRLPRGAQHTSAAILLALYSAAAVQLTLLFGVAAMRRETPGPSADEPEPDAPPRGDRSPGGIQVVRPLEPRPAPPLWAASRAAAPERGRPAAFLSYARADDSYGALSEFRDRLSAEVQMQIGRDFAIFQDRTDLQWGEEWRARIEETLSEVMFFIPILTPSFFASDECRGELRQFIAHERRLGQRDMILPVYYITTPLLEDPALTQADELAMVLSSRQRVDWREFRHESLSSRAAAQALARLAEQIRDALER